MVDVTTRIVQCYYLLIKTRRGRPEQLIIRRGMLLFKDMTAKMKKQNLLCSYVVFPNEQRGFRDVKILT